MDPPSTDAAKPVLFRGKVRKDKASDSVQKEYSTLAFHQ
jgi:hypothetical protein